jgi:hypothetical protein
VQQSITSTHKNQDNFEEGGKKKKCRACLFLQLSQSSALRVIVRKKTVHHHYHTETLCLSAGICARTHARARARTHTHTHTHKKPKKKNLGDGFLHHDDAPAHPTVSVNEFTARNKMIIIPHTPYSSGLATPHLFHFA